MITWGLYIIACALAMLIRYTDEFGDSLWKWLVLCAAIWIGAGLVERGIKRVARKNHDG